MFAISRKTVKGVKVIVVVEVESLGKVSVDRKESVGLGRVEWQKFRVPGSKRDWYAQKAFVLEGAPENATEELLARAEAFYSAYDAAEKVAPAKPSKAETQVEETQETVA